MQSNLKQTPDTDISGHMECYTDLVWTDWVSTTVHDNHQLNIGGQ